MNVKIINTAPKIGLDMKMDIAIVGMAGAIGDIYTTVWFMKMILVVMQRKIDWLLT